MHPSAILTTDPLKEGAAAFLPGRAYSTSNYLPSSVHANTVSDSSKVRFRGLVLHMFLLRQIGLLAFRCRLLYATTATACNKHQHHDESKHTTAAGTTAL